MKRNKITALLMAAVMLFSTAAYAADGVNTQEEQAIAYSDNMLKNMVRVYAHNIADNYYYGINDEELLFSIICKTIEEGKFNINSAIKAMIDTLDDEYAQFYTAQEYLELTTDIAGEFSGIGVTITQNENGIVVLSVMDGSPAIKAGVMKGDYIIAVNGQSVEGMEIASVKNLIVGESGSEVNVTVRRGEEEIVLTCVRGAVKMTYTQTKMLTDDIAYLKLIQFSKTAAEEVKTYVKDIQGKGIKKLVFDLRDNPGGDLDTALEIANIFISMGRIGELRYKDSSKNKYLYSENRNAPRLKIAVLVNENSASASELLSMAFQGRGAGKLVGTKTFGKGSMQLLSRAATGVGMKYTVGEFYTAKGQRVHTVGITPDIVVENEYVPVDEESFAKIDFDKIEEGANGGDMTLALEQRLSVLGYFDGTPDETFDEETKDAVMGFQAVLGYDATGVPGFYEYLYLNDYTYDFDVVVDKQMDAAIEYLNKR